MRNAIRLFGITALAAAIALSLAATLAACPSPTSGGGTPPHTHVWGAWIVTTAPTYTTEGVETRTCSGPPTHTETRPVPRLSYTAASVAGLTTLLAGLSANTPATAYSIKMDAADITGIRDALGADTGDNYVILDLSGSAITTIAANTFMGSASPYGTPALAGIILPDGLTTIWERRFLWHQPY
jgi:hypothetical protein